MRRTIFLIAIVALLLSPWFVQAQNPAQRVIIMDATGTHAASVSSGNALSTSAAVTVDTISHITSKTHVVGSMQITNQAGTIVTVTGTALDVNCTGCAAASVVAVSHISSALHIAGTINGAAFHIQGLGTPGSSHAGVLTIQGVTGMNPVASSQSGAWAVNVGHISSVLHVVVTDLPRSAHLAAAQSGSWTVQATHQGGNWNIAHIGGSLHVAGISNVGSGTTAGTTPMVCHSSQAFSLTADGVIAHANSGMRIFVCSIVMIAAAAENLSVVEGSGSACGTGKLSVIGGIGGTMSVAATGGFSSIAPFPWVSSSLAGNALCLDKSGSGNVSGVITYRGAP